MVMSVAIVDRAVRFRCRYSRRRRPCLRPTHSPATDFASCRGLPRARHASACARGAQPLEAEDRNELAAAICKARHCEHSAAISEAIDAADARRPRSRPNDIHIWLSLGWCYKRDRPHRPGDRVAGRSPRSRPERSDRALQPGLLLEPGRQQAAGAVVPARRRSRSTRTIATRSAQNRTSTRSANDPAFRSLVSVIV